MLNSTTNTPFFNQINAICDAMQPAKEEGPTWRELDEWNELCDHCAICDTCEGTACAFREQLIAEGVYDS